MLRRHLTRTALAAVGLALLAPTAAPAQSFEFPPRTYFFKCASGPFKLQNGNGLSPLLAARWSLAKPTASLQSGAGCGFLDSTAKGGNAATLYDAYYYGTHDEPIASIEVEVHNLILGRVRPGTTMRVGARLTLCAAAGCGNAASTLLQEKISTVTPTAGLNQATETVRLTFDGLKLPGYTQNRTLAITLDTPDGASGWVHDASDAPSKVTFFPPSQS